MSTFRHAGVCLLALLVAAGFLSAQTPGIAGWNSSPVSVISPDGQIALTLSDDGAAGLVYSVKFHGKRLIAESKLGLELVGQQPLGPWMKLAGEQAESADEAYTLPVGKTREVRDHYNGVRADYTDLDGRKLSIEVRAFDDGVAFRYIVPKQPSIGQTRIAHELTEFSFAKDASTYPLILDGYQSSWEDEYQLRNVSGLHPDWLIGLAVSRQRAGRGLGGDYRGGHRALRRHVSAQGSGFASRTVQADLSPHEDRAGNIDPSYAVETETPFSSPGAC